MLDSSHPQRPTVYPSAVDSWIGAMLLLTPICAAAIGIYLLVEGRASDAMILFFTGAVAAVVTIAFTLPCRYTLLDDTLSVRCGLLCYQIPLDTIESVEPSRTMISGPALSMKRVVVKTNRRSYVLSPKDRDQFVSDLSRVMNQPDNEPSD
ncbi:MAG: PH domain-containing protein [Rubripirellula sp.]